MSYLGTHLEEEASHDIWTLEDLEAAGFDADAAAAQMPSPDLAAMVGAQYYWIRHHPVLIRPQHPPRSRITNKC